MTGVIERNNVHVRSIGNRAMVFAHGLVATKTCGGSWLPRSKRTSSPSCSTTSAPGGSDLSAYDRDKYSKLAGHADDVVEIGRELDLQDAIFVGHSVSSIENYGDATATVHSTRQA